MSDVIAQVQALVRPPLTRRGRMMLALEEIRIDLVDIGTPNHVHHEQALEALAAG